MKISCGSCGAKYTVSDEKVTGKTVKVKCRKCSAVIVVSSTGEVQTTGGSSAGGGASVGGDVTYTVSVSDSDQRSMTMADIVKAYNEGQIDAETYCWTEGMDDWQPLKDVDAIVESLHQAAQGESPAQGAGLDRTVALAGGGGGGYDYAAPRPAAQPMAAASGDHFGAGTVALASSPYESAAAARPAASSGGGFFAVSAPAASPGGGTGKENSAIFSLDMLTAKVGAPTASAPTGTKEDSGLIDLKALASGMGGESGGIAAQVGPAAEVFPLGAPPPPQAIAAPSLAPAPQGGTSRGLIFALFGAVVVLGAALVFVVMSRSDVTPPTTPTSTPVAENTAAPPPTPTETVATPSTSTTAEPETTAATSDTAKVAGGPPPRPVPGGGGKVAAPPPPGGGGKPAPPPPKGGGGTGACGCSNDDLMCLMRCGTKKK
jgi:predicted Zn finger-like uncharacterized protein